MTIARSVLMIFSLQLLFFPFLAFSVLCPSPLYQTSSCPTLSSRSVSTDWIIHPPNSTILSPCHSTILLSKSGNFSFAFVPSDLNLTTQTSNGSVNSSESGYLLSVLLFPSRSLYCDVVWTANRNRPVTANAQLKLRRAKVGNDMVLQEADGTVVWYANAMGVVGITLHDSGNLIMYDGANVTVFQSFDHPTDTFVPGQLLPPGRRIISSVSSRNTSEGIYSVAMEPGGMVLYVNVPPLLPFWLWGNDNFLNFSAIFHTPCNRTALLYASDGLNAYLLQQNMSAECKRVWNPKWNSQGFVRETSYARIDVDGNLRVYDEKRNVVFDIIENNGGVACDLPGICGPYGICLNGSAHCRCPRDENNNRDFFKPIDHTSPSLGCKPLSPLSKCSTTQLQNGNLQLLEMTGIDYFANDMVSATITTLYNCKQTCLSNCSCLVAFYRQNSQSCYQYEHLMSLRLISDQSYFVYFKVGSAPGLQRNPGSTDSHSSGRRKRVIVGASLGASGVILLVGLAFSARYLHFNVSESTEKDEFLDALPGCPLRYSFRELQIAANGFSKLLGRGGFGSVYEGILSNGIKVAIKRLDNTKAGPKEFRAEVAALASINHVNLVRLYGFCAEKSHRLVVYEFMTNKSLDKWLFYEIEEKNPLLNWDTRFNVALGIARGLAFLHEGSRQRIIHLDIKPQNILLDENFGAKLSDFGLSKLLDETQSRALTTIRGTVGYLAPECVLQMGVTLKCDVYSFGMVLLEIVGKRRNIDTNLPKEKWYFPTWAIRKFEEGKTDEIVDACLYQEDEKLSAIAMQQATTAIKVALWCIREEVNVRPAMGTVILMLEGHMEVDDPPWSLPFHCRAESQLSVDAAASSSGLPILVSSAASSSSCALSCP